MFKFIITIAKDNFNQSERTKKTNYIQSQFYSVQQKLSEQEKFELSFADINFSEEDKESAIFKLKNAAKQYV
jgi:hypothetical protein